MHESPIELAYLSCRRHAAPVHAIGALARLHLDTEGLEVDLTILPDADGVRTLILNRPDRRNALNAALAQSLIDALRQANSDPQVGAVLIGGNGKLFCAGADLAEIKAEADDPQAKVRRSDVFLQLQLVFGEVDVPVVCAVEGAAIGLGVSIAIASDFTVMGQSARLALPEIAHGMLPSGVMGHVQHRLGRKEAFEMLALGQPMMAAQALEKGLVNRVVPDGQALDEARAFARTFAGHDRATMRGTKRLFVDTVNMPLREGLLAARESVRRRSL